MGKRGFYLSLDAIIASILLVVGLLAASTLYVKESETVSIEHYSQDMLNIISSARLYEMNSSIIDMLYASGKVDLNKTILEQAAQFWAEGNSSLAAAILNITSETMPDKFKGGIFFGNELIYGANESGSPLTLISAKSFITGIQKGKPVEGFSAQAQLLSFESITRSAYYYFGGFVGQGNITIRLPLPAINVTAAYLELDASDNFSMYINGAYSGSYPKGSAGGGYLLADKWQINSSYLANFNSGINYVSLKFPASLGFVGGGFLKVSYLAQGLNDSVSFYEGRATGRYYFPEIAGMINLFDSFFVPGSLETMSVHLHYLSNASTFLTLGNTTVFSLQSSGEQVADLPNENLDVKLDYLGLSGKTIPLRLGVTAGGNITLEGQGGTADVILVNDLSGSMELCAKSQCFTTMLGPARYCGTSHNYRPLVGQFCDYKTENYTQPGFGPVCSARWHGFCPVNDTRKLDIAVNASKAFTTILLGNLGNRLGVVGYTSAFDEVIPQNKTWADKFAPFPDGIVSVSNLTGNASLVSGGIDSYMDSYWGTCICCGIVHAREMFLNQSDSSRFRSIVVMSDGEATDKCTGVGTGNAKADAVKAAQDSCNDYNMSVSAVAFGEDADSETLNSLVCNNGTFYNATDVDQLIEAYRQIAGRINNVTYSEQRINVSLGNPAEGILFGDSYIEYNYTPNFTSEFGVIPATLESPRFGNSISEAALTVSPDMKLGEVMVTSYSGDKWTDNLTVGGRTAFSLSGFTSQYLAVGDPFAVYANPGLFVEGNNTVHISTGTGPANYTGGSPDNVIVYKVFLPNSVSANGVFAKADGCRWLLDFEDGSSTVLPMPGDYNGNESCSLSSFPANDAFDDAMFRLLGVLDFDDDGLVDVQFGTTGMEVKSFTVQKVPSLWGPAIAEVRVWQ